MTTHPQIPGFKILRELATGASGTVYLAVQEELSREVALKVLAAGLFDAEETRARFLREAKLQARLVHPNVLALYDAGFVGDTPYAAVEFVEGGSLKDWMDTYPLAPMPDLLRFGAEIAAGLAAAHEAGIVHRDLKPDNVLMTRDREMKVADFGLAKSGAPEQTVQTADGVILGTPGYLAPEVLKGATAGPGADIYALGMMLFEMVAGRSPFASDDTGAIFREQLQGGFPPASRFRTGVPVNLDTLIQKCLEVEPEDRPASMEAIEKQLESILDKLSGEEDVNSTRPDAASSSVGPVVQTQASGIRPTPRRTAVSRSDMPAQKTSARPATQASGLRQAASGVRRSSRTQMSTPAIRAANRPGSSAGRPSARVTSGLSSSATAPGDSQRKAISTMAGVAMVLIALTGGGLFLFLRQDSSGSAQAIESRDEPVETVDPAPADLPPPPEPLVTTGTDRARFWFSPGLEHPIQFELISSKGDALTTQVWSPGAPYYQIAGLEEKTSYSGGLLLGGRRRELNFRSRSFSKDRPAIDVHYEKKHHKERDIQLSGRGERMGATWVCSNRDKLQAVLFSLTLDQGVTWSAPREVSDRSASSIKSPQIAATDSGWQAAWIRDGVLEQRALSASPSPWPPVRSGPSGKWDDVCLTAGPRSKIDWFGFSEVGTRGRLFWKRTGVSGEVILPESSLDFPGIVESLQAIWSSNLPVAFVEWDNETGDGDDSLHVTRIGPDGFQKPTRLTGVDADVYTWDSILFQRRIVVVHDNNHATMAQQSTDGGVTFSEPTQPAEAIFQEELPRLATNGPTLFLTAIHGMTDGLMFRLPTLRVLASRDGTNWSRVTKLDVGMQQRPDELESEAGPDRLVVLFRAGGKKVQVFSLPFPSPHPGGDHSER